MQGRNECSYEEPNNAPMLELNSRRYGTEYALCAISSKVWNQIRLRWNQIQEDVYCFLTTITGYPICETKYTALNNVKLFFNRCLEAFFIFIHEPPQHKASSLSLINPVLRLHLKHMPLTCNNHIQIKKIDYLLRWTPLLFSLSNKNTSAYTTLNTRAQLLKA